MPFTRIVDRAYQPVFDIADGDILVLTSADGQASIAAPVRNISPVMFVWGKVVYHVAEIALLLAFTDCTLSVTPGDRP